jgi:hypothetical protein
VGVSHKGEFKNTTKTFAKRSYQNFTQKKEEGGGERFNKKIGVAFFLNVFNHTFARFVAWGVQNTTQKPLFCFEILHTKICTCIAGYRI